MARDISHFVRMGKSFEDLQKNKELCDVVLTAGDKDFPAHKVILAAESKYFRAMFTSGFKESNQAKVKLDVNPAIFEVLFRYIYTGKLDVTQETIVDVLEMACYMQFTQVCNFCTELLGNCFGNSSTTGGDDLMMLYGEGWEAWEVSLAEAFKYCMLADNRCLPRLAELSQKFLVKSYKQLKGLDTFLDNGTADFLEKFLNQEKLSDEQQVLEMVVCWLKHDWKNRSADAHRLLQKVRLGLIPVKGIKKWFDAEIRRIPECKLLMDTVLQLKASKNKASLAQKHPEFFATRTTITVPICGYVRDTYGGQQGCFKYYSDKDNRWHYMSGIPCLPYPLIYHGIIVVDGTLYVAGGELEQNDEGEDIVYNDFFSYDSAKHKWKRLPSMKTPRRGFHIVHLDGFIYVMRGGNNECYNGLCSVERYNISKKEWQSVASMPESVSYTPSVVAYKGKLIAICEDETSDKNTMIQMYSPSTDNWQVVYQEPTTGTKARCRETALIIHNDVLYRVKHKIAGIVATEDFFFGLKYVPAVNKLEIRIQNDTTSIVVGEEVKQDHIPPNLVNAFRIGDQVLLNPEGLIINTGVVITPDQSSDVDLTRFTHFKTEDDESNVAHFTFDPAK